MDDAAYIIKLPARITGRTKIVRSFSYKLNVGKYESRDFFCSQSADCDIEDAEEIGDLVYQFCKRQVFASVKEYKRQAVAAGDGNAAAFEHWKENRERIAS